MEHAIEEPGAVTDAPTPSTSTNSHVVLPWIVRLRWVSLAALAAAGWAAEMFWRVRLPPLSIVLLAALALTNGALTFQIRTPSPRRSVVAAVLLLDVGLLTGILYLVGGPLNPFSIIYLVEITFAAITLGHRWAVFFACVSNVAYGVTFFYSQPLDFRDPAYSGNVMTLHLSGMWVALGAASGLIAHFVSRVSEALERRETELTEVRAAAARSDRLAALLSLGAGAAHELATPLSTISTAAHELVHQLRDTETAPASAVQYAIMIRSEVERCRTVLDQLSGRASSSAVEETEIPLPQLIADVRYRLGESLSRRLDAALPPRGLVVHAPVEPLRQTLVALLRNAFDASRADQRVSLAVDATDGMLRFEVVDRGRGMSQREAARAGDPFFTTKPHGAGLGLGLFLARSFADQVGGTLRWTSASGSGTSVVLQMPDSEPG
ncbi:MAG: ATP-binding protein [Vicinamibacterales bacterium]